jgi:ATP-dependent helicase/nuclease subunit B
MDVPFDLPPDAILITGPAGSGKTSAAIDAILDTRLFNPFSTIWVLLANRQQIHAFQERLIAVSPDAVQFGVEFFDFETLYLRLLDLLGRPQRLVEDTARFQILRHVTTTLRDQGELELFGEIAHTPGFIGLLAGLIHELKQGLVQPEDFARAANNPKDRDLARIYAAYQTFLQDKNLVDRHGAGWLAVAHLARGEKLPVRVDLLVVDGFDQLNRVHIALLTALARQVSRSVLTLTDDQAGRRFRRFEQTRERVIASAPDLWRIEPVSQPPPDAMRPPALDHLVNTIFQSNPSPQPGDGTLRLIEAPDVEREVGAVLRRVKRLLLDGTPPETIAVIARDMRQYSTTLRETARTYGIPLVVREGLPVAENPAVALLLDLIDLHALDFPRRELLDTLHSPYLDPPDLTSDQIAHLERLSLTEQVVRGRASWLSAIHTASLARTDEDGESGAVLDAAEAADLHDALIRHFDRITPPPNATPFAYTRWLESLIGPDPAARAHDTAEVEDLTADPAEHDSFNLLACVRAASDSARAARDIIALQAFKRVLRGIRAAHDLLNVDGSLSWPDFRAELGLAVERTSVIPPGGLSRLGRVLATDALEARGLPHDHVFIVGLTEGVFPAQEPEGALYQEGERLALERAQIDMLTAAERSDDMSLFYQALGLARRTLTLSRYTVDDKGAPCPESPYWHAVRAAITIPGGEIAALRTGAAPALDETATLSEAAVAVAALFSAEYSRESSGDPTAAARVYNALLDHRAWGTRWRNVLRGRALEARRENPAHPFDRHSGVLSDPNLIAIVARRLDAERTWSASQFNDFGLCPFRFFARRLLRLEELKEPEEGLDQLQLGSLNHAILERTYHQIAAERLDITPANQDRALDILDATAAAVFATAPTAYGFRTSPVWTAEQDEIRRRLHWLVAQDFSDNNPFAAARGNHPIAQQIQGLPRQPFLLETAFPALVIDGPAGPLRARGVIDRLDRAGDAVMVVDYKTGSTPHTVPDMADGRDFQMMLYLLAAREIVAHIDPALTVVGGLFWHIRSRAISGEVLITDEALDSARAHLHADILDARAGRFPVRPSRPQGNRCATYCEFRALCRLTRANQRKSFTAEIAEDTEK